MLLSKDLLALSGLINVLLIFLLQKALFSFHFISSHAICDNLFSKNLKFLHWASIFIGNPSVSVLPVNTQCSTGSNLARESCIKVFISAP